MSAFARELAAKDAEIARLREAVLGSRPFVKLAVTQEQAEASARWHSKAMAALSAIDASLSSSVAPDPAEAICDALEPFATFGLTDDPAESDIRDDLMRDRICDWFGPSDFDAARRAYARPPAPAPAEAIRAKCEAMIREESEKLPDSYVRSKKRLIHVADEIAALKDNGEGK